MTGNIPFHTIKFDTQLIGSLILGDLRVLGDMSAEIDAVSEVSLRSIYEAWWAIAPQAREIQHHMLWMHGSISKIQPSILHINCSGFLDIDQTCFGTPNDKGMDKRDGKAIAVRSHFVNTPNLIRYGSYFNVSLLIAILEGFR